MFMNVVFGKFKHALPSLDWNLKVGQARITQSARHYAIADDENKHHDDGQKAVYKFV